MSSFEEENLYQMIDHDDLLDPQSTPQVAAVLPISSHESPFLNDHRAKYYILQEILESGTKAAIDVLGTVIRHMRKKSVDAGDCTAFNKEWLVKSLKKDGYNTLLCHTSWPTTLNCPGGEYEYIAILCDCKKGGTLRMIVDLDFKSQFELARPTSNYKELCDMLPSIFVGDEQKLNKIISILCGEAKNSFCERGLYVPPWRTPCYMHSKWFSPCQKLPKTSSRREFFTENVTGRIGVSVSSKLITPRRKYDQICGLSSEFSAMSTKCI